MVLRPAEIAVIILTFSKYAISPFHALIGLDSMDEDKQQLIVKIVSYLALGKK